MSNDTEQTKSLIDVLYEEYLESLIKTGEFDEKFLEKLTTLIENGDIRKFQKVADLLNSVGDEMK